MGYQMKEVIEPMTYPGTSVKVETGAEALFKLFQYHGVDYIFASPGTEWRGIWDAVAKSIHQGEKRPRYLQLLHEAQAVAMAIGYAAYTGRAQVVPFHANLGQLHAAMEIHGAYRNEIPMVLMSSGSVTFEGEMEGSAEGPHYFNFQEYHMGNLLSPYVKWDYEVHTNKNLPQVIGRAFQIAYTPSRGPVHLFVPKELMEEKVNSVKIPETKPFSPPRRLSVDVENLLTVAKLLVDSENPLIIAGGTYEPPMNPECFPSLIELAEMLAIPVITSGTHVDFPTTHDLHMGFRSGPYLKEADTILIVNYGNPWLPPQGPPETSKIVFIGADAIKRRWPYWGFRAEQDLLIECDVKCGLDSLIRAVRSTIRKEKVDKTRFVERRQRWEAEHERQRASWLRTVLDVKDRKPVDSRWLSYNVGQVIDEDTIIVAELISPTEDVNMYIPRTKPATKFGNFGAAGLGQGIGVAQGIKLASPDRTVVLLIGDGSFNYNPVTACLWASREYSLPLLIVIYDNGSYESMGSSHLTGFPDGWGKKTGILPGAWLREYEYSKLADAFDFYGIRIEDPSAAYDELKRALNEVKRGRSAIVDVRIARSRIPNDSKRAAY